MPRKPYIAQSRFPYHIMNRCNNRDWFTVPLPTVWGVFCEQLSNSADRYSVCIHSFVLMSNHFHLMVLTSSGNLDQFLRHLLTEVCRSLKKESKRINHIFGGRSKQTVLDSSYAVAYVYKYIYRNPVRAGLAERVEDYRFSSLYHSKLQTCPIPIADGLEPTWSLIPKGQNDREAWLNLPTSKEKEELITRALRRTHFRFSRSNSIRKDLAQLSQSYAISHVDPYLLSPEGE